MGSMVLGSDEDRQADDGEDNKCYDHRMGPWVDIASKVLEMLVWGKDTEAERNTYNR